MPRFLLLFMGWLAAGPLFAQTEGELVTVENDSIPSSQVVFTSSSASEYIIKLLKSDDLFKPEGDTMKLSLTRLTHHYQEPFDSVANRLSGYNFNQINPRRTIISKNDTLPLRWLNKSAFIVDTVTMEREPFIIRKTIVMKAPDTSVLNLVDRMPDMKFMIDSILQVRDTITDFFIDTLFLESKKIKMHHLDGEQIVPPLIPPGAGRSARLLPDSSKAVISERTRVYMADDESPFFIVPNTMMPDSLRSAVETLLQYTYQRDSMLLYISDLGGIKTPFWLTTRRDELQRYWVKNQENDSITLWIGNPTKNEIALILEEDVQFERMEKKLADDIPIVTLSPQRSLASLAPLKEIPVYWKYGLSNAFILNQTFLSNWSKGGENSLSSMLDMRATATYTNAENKIKWDNSGRIRYGTIITEEYGFRTNTDMVELNSQYNKVIRQKIDFSSVFYMKTQVDKGYNYPNDSVVVSRFLNPGTFTVGVGFEYKPFKNTLLNFSVLSYKNTFVLDTANINQTKHGIAGDRRSRQEMGGQLVIRNTVSILDGLNISNAIRLFSGYLDKPQNVDVDWEINLDKQISWFFMIRLNLHFIYDDDIRFPVLDSNKQPVLMPDGSEKRVPKLQFKQFLGLTLSFKI